MGRRYLRRKNYPGPLARPKSSGECWFTRCGRGRRAGRPWETPAQSVSVKCHRWSSSYGLPVEAGRLTRRERAVGPSLVDDWTIYRVSRDFTRHRPVENPHCARLSLLLSLPVSVRKAGFKKSRRVDAHLLVYCTGLPPTLIKMLLVYRARIAPRFLGVALMLFISSPQLGKPRQGRGGHCCEVDSIKSNRECVAEKETFWAHFKILAILFSAEVDWRCSAGRQRISAP